jgi:hypothetical protein
MNLERAVQLLRSRTALSRYSQPNLARISPNVEGVSNPLVAKRIAAPVMPHRSPSLR